MVITKGAHSQAQIKKLKKKITLCLSRDRFFLKRELDRLLNEQRQGKMNDEKFLQLADKITYSLQKKENRQASIPTLVFPDLPISERKDEIAQLISAHQVVIVCGETGSGKTTQLPKICLSVGRGCAGFIGHTQPRRIAARTVANRIVEELGETMGQSVGYKIRFHDKTQERSLVKVVTDGILLAEIQADRFLSQYDTLIIDEAHERSLNIDFLLGYLKWLLPKRPDLKLIITSATIDPQRFSKHFNDAPIIEVSGRTYPVEIRYQAIGVDAEDNEEAMEIQAGIVAAVQELYRDIRGDILIFLTGERDIRDTADTLQKSHGQVFDILPLYSKLSISEQERIFKPATKPRIVLATNVAETSLTVPGIRSVIDVGLARISRYSQRSKIQRLPIEAISRASANQRAGRCGRVAPGICIRLYSEEDYLNKPEFTEPEILRTNLASVILQMTTLKLGDIKDFPFLERPDSKMIRDGVKVLHEISALDLKEQMTALGKQIARVPLDPKLARTLIGANHYHCLTEISIIASGLSIQDPREKPVDKMHLAEAKHAAYKAENSDFLSFLKLWNKYEAKKSELSNNRLRKYCRENFLSYVRMREWQDVRQQINLVIRNELKFKANQTPASYQDIHQALLTGLLSNIGFKHEQYEYLGARNHKFFIFPGSGQYKLRPKWIVAAEHVETSKVYARNVAKIEPEWVEENAQHLIKRSYYEPHWEKKAGRCAIFERTALYGLTLRTKRKIPYEHVDPEAARAMFIRFGLVYQEYQTTALFFKENQRLLEELDYIQHKGRRVDLIEGEEWLYDFYDKKIAASVVSGVTFEKWRKTAERTQPNLLFLKKEDVAREQDLTVNEQEFPDEIVVGQSRIKLQYKFEPGDPDDGVTAQLPIQQLNQLVSEPFEWLVPGLRHEKLCALMKALPKQWRKKFVPVPQTIDRCLEIEPDYQSNMSQWLSDRLRRLTGESVPLNLWQVASIADHLIMNFKVVGDDGKLIATGRDLQVLQQSFKTASVISFEQIAQDELNLTGYIQWAFDTIPNHYHFQKEGQDYLGYPALIDEGETVGLRLLETEFKAQQCHQIGLVRLFQLTLKKERKYLLKNLSLGADVELAYQQLREHPYFAGNVVVQSLKEDFLFLCFREVFVGESVIRCSAEFEQALKKKSTLSEFSIQATTLVRELLKSYLQLSRQLAKQSLPSEVAEEIKSHLNGLIFKGFIREIPYQHLLAYPRYLNAVSYRLEKRLENSQKDQQKLQEISRFNRRYWASVMKRAEQGPVVPAAENFRWCLEEFRVSLFAQHLKTSYPVSAKRLEKLWDF